MKFQDSKTIFQTAEYYDAKIGIAADGVIVHRHCDVASVLAPSIKSWNDKGPMVGVMFFADSDGANEYWTGKWDGTPHPDDREFKANGEVVMCEHRPYMVPTKGWTEHLIEKVKVSLECKAKAIMPEEPLAHTFAGYSESFKKIWKEYYGFDWMPESSSAFAHFLTGELKAILYLNLEKELLKTTKKINPDADFIIPIHSIFGNISSMLTAPLGMSVGTEGVDGYIGQIWTGPIRWAMANYNSEEKSFFASAFALYDYFTQITVKTDKKLWLLVDPVEDDPNHSWNEFAEWYEHSVAAMLMMSGINTYEIMPWPDRMFLPGHETGGGTPAPEDFRMRVLSITQVLQDIEKGGEWLAADGSPCEMSNAIAIAIADSAMYQKRESDKLQGLYGMFMPLISQGIPVKSFVLERATDKNYADIYKVIILNYEEFKPVKEEMNLALAEWVKRGGTLIIFGESLDELDNEKSFWWHKLGFASPTEHLVAQFSDGVGAGKVISEKISTANFANVNVANERFLPIVRAAIKFSGVADDLFTPGMFCMRRGDYIIAHSLKKDIVIDGKFINIFNPTLPIVDKIHLTPGQSGLYKDVSKIIETSDHPTVLQTTHRLISQKVENSILKFTVKGPAETPAAARLFTAGKEIQNISAVNVNGEKIDVEIIADEQTAMLKFPNSPDSITITIS